MADSDKYYKVTSEVVFQGKEQADQFVRFLKDSPTGYEDGIRSSYDCHMVTPKTEVKEVEVTYSEKSASAKKK